MGKWVQREGKQYYLIEQSSSSGMLFTRNELANAKARADRVYYRSLR